MSCGQAVDAERGEGSGIQTGKGVRTMNEWDEADVERAAAYHMAVQKRIQEMHEAEYLRNVREEAKRRKVVADAEALLGNARRPAVDPSMLLGFGSCG